MQKTLRRFLSMLLVFSMIFSLTAQAAGSSQAEKNASSSEAQESGPKELQLEEVDPAKLNIPRLGVAGEEEETAEPKEAGHGLNDMVRVSIVLEKASTLDAGYAIQGIAKNKGASDYRQQLKNQQDALAKKISSEILGGAKLDVKWNITLAGNMISANVPYGKIEAIKALDGVVDVFLETQYEPMKGVSQDSPNMISARDMTGTSLPFASDYTGAGSKLAIIDTGLDYEHQSFDPDAFQYAIDEVQAGGYDVQLMTAADIPSNQLNGNGKYLNAKVPYAYNYVDGNLTINHASDTQEEHGSHVAGIAAANRYINVGGKYVDAGEAVGVVGQAPDAQVFIMKVFGAGGGAYDSDYMVAIEDALILGADSVNLSLGSSNPGPTTITNASYRTIFQNLVGKGMVVSISAGNNTSWDSNKKLYADDINFDTAGSPGSFSNALTVASVNDSGVRAPFLLFNNELELRYTEGGGAANNALMITAAGKYDYVYVDAFGTPEDFAKVDVRGKVAICNRGTTSFYEKANAAVAAGAVAVIIVNNQAGTISMALDGYTYTNPVVSIKQAEGVAIKEISEKGTSGDLTYYTGMIEIGGKDNLTPMSYFEMSSFSGWGVPGSLILKPEITAPGGSVYSLNGYHKNATGGGYSGGHDQYEYMSGTSMAAPQITGLTAVFGEHYRRNGLAEKTGLPLRTLAQSLLMSTAVPMKEEASRNYYSILNQGAGLANINGAVQAKTYILMNAAATRSAADGKVKAELGDDPSRSGAYSYSFTIYNFGDEDITYEVNTDLFTQALEANNTLLSHQVESLAKSESISWVIGDFSCDVNKDGATNDQDVQAILNAVTGILSANDAFDAGLADQDGDDAITSYDAYLLADKLANPPAYNGYVVPARSQATVTVSLKLTEAQKQNLNQIRKGAYVEGYTFLEGDDGVTHSIPILAFYGSWTDPSMFNAVTYVENYYGSSQSSYFNANNANLLYIRYNGSSTDTIFLGNQYVKEAEFPEDRLALNNSANIYQATYTLIRSAGTRFSAITKEDGSVLFLGGYNNSYISGAYYNTQSNSPSWQGTNVYSASINKSVSSLGLKEGEKFTAGFYALPEYYAFAANGNDAGVSVAQNQIEALLASGTLGEGACLGYTFTVDNTAPTFSAVLNEDGTVTVTAQDNQYIAAIGVLNVSGKTVLRPYEVPAQSAPGSEVSLTFDPVEIGAAAANACTIVVADYAGNEYAAIIPVGEGPVLIEKEVYVLTNAMEAGKEYLITNSNAAGSRYALNNNNGSVARYSVAVQAANDTYDVPFIDGEDIPVSAVWSVSEGFKITNQGSYLRANGSWMISLQISGTDSNNSWTWDGTNNRLSVYANNRTYYLRYNNNNFSINTATNSIYLFEKKTYTEEFDLYNAESVTVTPESAELFTGNTVQLFAEVLPITVPDRSVSWSSSDEAIATVDENGLVTAVSAGTATITAESNQTAGISASAAITVTAVYPLRDATVNAQIVLDGTPSFVRIDLADMSMTTLGEAAGAHYGGGRSADVITGFMSDGNIVTTWISDDGYESFILGSFGTTQYNSRDGAHVPPFCAVMGDETVIEEYMSLYVSSSYLLMLTEEGALTGWSGANYSAICYAGTDVKTGWHYYYLLNNNGQFLTAAIGPDEEEPIGEDDETGEPVLNLVLSTSTATAIRGLSSSTGTFGANNMSMSVLATDDYYGLLIANTSNKRIYFVDLTKDDLTAVLVAGFNSASGLTTLYNDDLDAEIVPLELEAISPIFREAKAEMEVNGNAIKAEKLGQIEKAEPKAAGGLQAARNLIPPVISDTSAKIDVELKPQDPAGQQAIPVSSQISVSLIEEEDTNNARYEISYDPAKLSFDRVEFNAVYGSANIDEENGIIIIAFADAAGIEAGKAIANIFFEIPGCEDSVISVSTTERNQTLSGIDEDFDVPVQGYGHKWGEPVYEWKPLKPEGFEVTATRVCETDPDHVETETVTAELKAIIAPGCETTGTGYYEAVFENPAFETQISDKLLLPAAGHKWGEPAFEWKPLKPEGFEVTASMVCLNDESHTETETVKAEFKVITEPGCEKPGTGYYEAVFKNPAFGTKISDKTSIPATGHSWGGPKWSWAEDYSRADAVFVCSRCGEEEKIAAEISSEWIDGYDVYTASAEFEGKTYTEIQKIESQAAAVIQASLTLNARIDANIYIQAPESAVKAVLSYTKAGAEDVVYDLTATQKWSGDIYRLVFPNIHAKEMTDVVSVTLYDAAGNEIRLIQNNTAGRMNGNSYEYRVVDWAQVALKSDMDQKYKDLAKALLNYGTAAQLQFNYRLNDLADPTQAILQAEMDAVEPLTENDAEFPDEETCAALGYIYMSLNLEGATEIFLYFDHEVTVKDGAYEVRQRGNNYIVVIPGIIAKKLNEKYTVVIVEDGTEYSFTASALSYANRVLRADFPETLKNVVKALYLYNAAAIEAFR